MTCLLPTCFSSEEKFFLSFVLNKVSIPAEESVKSERAEKGREELQCVRKHAACITLNVVYIIHSYNLALYYMGVNGVFFPMFCKKIH